MPKFTIILICIGIAILTSNTEAQGYYRKRPNQTPGGIRPTLPPTPPLSPTPNGQRRFTLGIMAYDNMEVLDFAGPFEVFAVTGEMFQTFRVLAISNKKHIVAVNGLKIEMDYVIGDRNIPKLDILVVPGSSPNATTAVMNDPVFMNFIKEVAPRARNVISVCTGVNMLCRAGLVDGLDLTTHHQLFEMAERNCPRSKFWKDRRFTDNGKILTSAGISAGIDVSLYFVKKVAGTETARSVASRMEYDWKDFNYDPRRGVTVGTNVNRISG